MRTQLFRVCLALGVAVLLAGNLGIAAQTRAIPRGPDYSRGHASFPNVFEPYAPIRLGSPDLTNSPRIEQLIRDGKLELSLQDAIALALENNMDISVQRYVPWIADTDILRAKSGDAPRGQSGTGTAAILGSIPFQSFDPVVTTSIGWSRAATPVNNPFLSGTGVALAALTNYTMQANFQYSQGFITGTSYAITFNNARASSTSPAQLFNPSVSSTLFFSFTQQLLNGFGFLPNTRFIQIARTSKRIADYTFANQVITTVTQVEHMYWDLVYARENVKVTQRSVDLAQKRYNDNKRQVEIGTLAPIEVVRAEAQLATTRQELIVSQTALLQQQTVVKNAISKNPMDSLLLNVEVVPTDVIVVPPQVEVLPLQDAVKEAVQRRPDVKQAELNVKTNEVNARATRNALMPTLSLFGQYGGAGLSGNSRSCAVTVASGSSCPPASVIVNTSGLGATWAGMSGFDFPTYTVALNLTIPIKNRAAQADNARAVLQQRQAEVQFRQVQNNVVVDVRNAQIALQQSLARVTAAQKARELAQQTLDAEQKKFQLGASTIFLVIQAQRDLAQARSTEVQSLTQFVEARVDYDRALGRTLEMNNISLAEAQSGHVFGSPLIPGTVIGETLRPDSGKAAGSGQKF
jgi:outer membrane protein TolC